MRPAFFSEKSVRVSKELILLAALIMACSCPTTEVGKHTMRRCDLCSKQ
jgi:hypothetical protein